MMFSHVVPAMIMAGALALIGALRNAASGIGVCVSDVAAARAVVCLHGALRNPVPPARRRRR
jgi:hypothetical protein